MTRERATEKLYSNNSGQRKLTMQKPAPSNSLLCIRGNARDCLERVGLTPASARAAAAMMWRATLIGIVLYLSLSDDRYLNLQRNLIAFIVAFVWCYYDGVLTKRRWSFAWIEAVFLHLMVVQVGNLLTFAFGSPWHSVAD